MERWTRLSDASWQKFESIFEANLRTPPLACTVPRTPNAPKKPCKQARRGDRLQPRRLVFDSEHQARPRTRRQDRPRARGEPIRVWEDSGVALWSSSATSTQRSNERRLRSTPRSDSGNKKHKITGSTRVKAVVDEKRDRANSKKDDDPIKPNFRALRI